MFVALALPTSSASTTPTMRQSSMTTSRHRQQRREHQQRRRQRGAGRAAHSSSHARRSHSQPLVGPRRSLTPSRQRQQQPTRHKISAAPNANRGRRGPRGSQLHRRQSRHNAPSTRSLERGTPRTARGTSTFGRQARDASQLPPRHHQAAPRYCPTSPSPMRLVTAQAHSSHRPARVISGSNASGGAPRHAVTLARADNGSNAMGGAPSRAVTLTAEPAGVMPTAEHRDTRRLPAGVTPLAEHRSTRQHTSHGASGSNAHGEAP